MVAQNIQKVPNPLSDSSVLEAVCTCLEQKGKSIVEIESEHNRTYEGDKIQQEYVNKPIWHTKRALDKFVIQYLKVDETKHASRIRIKTAKAISVLRTEGVIEDWNSHRRFGLWRLSKHYDVTNDFIVIVGKRDKERFRQFKTQQHQNTLQTIKETKHTSNIWALNSHRQHSRWSKIKRGDRMFFAVLDSKFSHYGIVYKTLQSSNIATKLWGSSPRTLLHDCLILFSFTGEISEPFHETCRNAGIKTPILSDGIYISKCKMLVTSTYSMPAGIVLDHNSHDGPATKKSEAVTRFIRDTKKARQLKKKYGDECQVCGYTLQINSKQRYSEVHHIHPLKDGGDDDFANMLVLCPTHHVEFDYQIIGIDVDAKTIIDRNGKHTGQLVIHQTHKIALKNIKFHLARMNINEF